MKKALFFLLLVMGYHIHSRAELATGVDWIYFSPISESFRLGEVDVTGGGVENITQIHNRLDKFYSGYRVWASYECDDSYIGFQFTHLSVRNRRSFRIENGSSFIINPFSTLTNNFASFVQDRKRFLYVAAEGVIGVTPLLSPIFELDVFAGFHYANIRSDDDFFYQIDILPLVVSFNAVGSYLSHFSGVGPEIGVNFSYLVCGLLDFNLQAASAFVIGGTRGANPYTTVSALTGEILSINEIKAKTTWRAIPFGTLGVGFNYGFALPAIFGPWGEMIDADLEIGYEGLIYFNALLDIERITDSRTYHNVIMHGPYISFGLYY